MLFSCLKGNTVRNILFVEKVFLSRAIKPLCGVELLNLSLIKDLAAMGYFVTVLAHTVWSRVIKAWVEDSQVDIIDLPWNSSDMLGGLLALNKLGTRYFDLLLLGNVGNSLIPIISLLRWKHAARRIALIAHREPKTGFLRALNGLPITVLAVNERIKSCFARANFSLMRMRYGIAGADQLYPARPTGNKPKPWVDFCVTGHLDRKWKGADTAEAGFVGLPDDVRNKCRLHLVGFSNLRAFAHPSIIPYGWLPFEQMGNFLRTMDVMLVPSRDDKNIMKETFSQATVQGMLTGLPLIVSNLPILTEKITIGGGLIFDDVDGLTQAMRRLAEDLQLRQKMGEQGRQTALQRYIWSTPKFIDEIMHSPANIDSGCWPCNSFPRSHAMNSSGYQCCHSRKRKIAHPPDRSCRSG